MMISNMLIKYKPKTKQELQDLCDDKKISLKDIDTSLIYDMSNLFSNSDRTNSEFEGIEDWDVSKVEDMSLMFYGCRSFNRDINKWDVSKVTNMYGMFTCCECFNKPLDKWDVSNVKEMKAMFQNATNFNQDISSWNTRRVEDMCCMFNNATNFNQYIGSWNTSSVENMSSMFEYATNFNQNISNWDTSSVEDMSYMFNSATNFNQDISSWNTHRVDDMSYMFSSAKNFNQDISKWNIHRVTDFVDMFNGASSFKQDLSSWKADNKTLGIKDDVITSVKEKTNVAAEDKKECSHIKIEKRFILNILLGNTSGYNGLIIGNCIEHLTKNDQDNRLEDLKKAIFYSVEAYSNAMSEKGKSANEISHSIEEYLDFLKTEFTKEKLNTLDQIVNINKNN